MLDIKTFALTLFVLLTALFKGYSQRSSADVNLDEFPNMGGVVFEIRDDVWLSPGEDLQFHILSKNEIIRAEYLIDSLYQSFLTDTYENYLDSDKLSRKEKSAWLKTIKRADYFANFGNYARQYAGFKDTNKTILVAIYLLDFSNDKYLTNYFEDWKDMMVVGFGDFYEQHTRYFVVNLDTNEIMR